MIPKSAQRIADARLAKRKPKEMVLISMIGNYPAINPVVYLHHGVKYDYWWLTGLDICLITRPTLPWRQRMHEIGAHKPRSMSMWDDENQEGCWVYLLPTLASLELGTHADQWDWELSFITWLPSQNRKFQGDE